MNIQEKFNYIQTNFLSEWLKTRQEVENEFSDRQSMFCICGRLATGLHERGCKKFRNRIDREALKRLSPLLARIK